MSETQEIPIPQEFKDVPPLSPEVEEQRRAVFERVQAESRDPSAIISRSIDEMGFFEGLLKVTEPYRKEKVNIMWKNFIAKTSLVLSLIPVVGEGKAFLGVVREGGKIKRFEPVFRATVAAHRGSREFSNTMKATVSTEKLIGKIAHTKPARLVAGSWKGIREMSKTMGRFGVRDAVTSMNHLEATNKLFAAKQAASRTKNIEYITERTKRLSEAGYANGARWFDAIGKFKVWRIDSAAKKVAKNVMKTHGDTRAVHAIVAGEIGTGNKAAQWIGEKAVHAKSAIDVGLKKRKFMAFFDSVFNLTPDVPHWLSLTTAVGEMAGMHGVDSISAMVQLGKNSLHEAKITRTMMKDVWRFTNNRLLGSRDVPKAASEVYAAAKGAQAVGA